MFIKKLIIFSLLFLFSCALMGQRMVVKKVDLSGFDEDDLDLICHINKKDRKSLSEKEFVPLDLILIKENPNSFLAKNWKWQRKRLMQYPFFPVRFSKEKELIIVVLKEQYLAFYKNGYFQFCAPVSTGKNNNTPVGKFKVFYRSEYHISSLYSDPMPYTLCFTQYHAIHYGRLPGYPASHGCVRTLKDSSKFLFFNSNLPVVLIVDSIDEIK
ncbi:L,D-transpeptidase family protein [Patescibacteria group bacterium]|nr:L,D-transpeptidase family protein [Patescibacteria group bacterium]